MAVDFSQPQRLSSQGLVVMYLYQVQAVLRATWYMVLIFLIKAERTHLYVAAACAALVLVVSMVLAWRRYVLFTFYINKAQQEFVVQSGLLTRNTLVIQLDKIQQVHIKQDLLQQLIGVYTVHIDTAGAAHDEAQLKAVRLDVALALQQRLQQAASPATVTAPEQTTSLVQRHTWSWLTLVKVGLTSRYRQSLGLIAIAFFTTYNSLQEVEHLIPEAWIRQLETQWLPLLTLMLPVWLVVGTVVFLIFNLIRTLVRFYGYTIENQAHSVSLQYGLLSRQTLLLRPTRVQWLSFTQNPLMRYWRLTDISVHQVKGHEKDKMAQHRAEVPGCVPTTVAHFTALFLPNPPADAVPLLSNWRKMLFPTLLGWLGLTALYFAVDMAPLGQLICGLIALAMPFWQYIRYKKSMAIVSDQRICIQEGVWDVTCHHLDVHKIQTLRLRQFAWHRSADIGHIRICTAAGSLHFTFGSYKALHQWINAALFHIESGRQSWM